MNVDRNEKIWAYSNSGTRMHAFVSEAENGKLRAMCRKTIVRFPSATRVGRDEAHLICPSCLKKALEMWDRMEASMQPSSDYHAEGWVEPVADEKAAPINRDAKIWGYTRTGETAHAFVNDHAMCNKGLSPWSEPLFDHARAEAADATCARCDVKFKVALWVEPVADEAHKVLFPETCDKRVDDYRERERTHVEGVGYVDRCKTCKVPCDEHRLFSETEPVADEDCNCGHSRVSTPQPLGADMHATGCPVRPEPVVDEDAVIEALDCPAVIDALHAEALEMDEYRTAKVDLLGQKFRPVPGNAHRKANDVITPTRIWISDKYNQVCVSYDIESDDWRNRRVVSHSTIRVGLFRKLYRKL